MVYLGKFLAQFVMWQTTGHQNVKKILDRFLERQIFPHALLFVGPSGVGKRTLAVEYARALLGSSDHDISTFNAGNSDIDQTRHFLQQLALTPSSGSRKVAIIDNMDSAGLIISNALLKTLEEPSASTHLILIAGTAGVLPTISSRCQTLRFNRLSAEEMTEFSQKLSLKVTPEALALSTGRPGQLEFFTNNSEQLSLIQSSLAKLETAANGNPSDQLIAITALAELETEELFEVLRAWLYVRADQLHSDPTQHTLIGRVLEALSRMTGTFNKKLVLQRLLLRSHQ
jgi:DNA polymerase III delta prime subunit